MPIYEYRCPNGHVFEVLQRMNDAQPEVCEVCGEGPLERVLQDLMVFIRHIRGRIEGYVAFGHEALDYVAGYCTSNDFSARDLQLETPSVQWLIVR